MKKLFTLMMSCLMALSLVGCGGHSWSTPDDTLVVGAEELTGTFSPAYYSSSYDGYVVDLVYDALVAYNYDSELEPVLAAEMPTVSEDGKTVSVKLREGVKFSNGNDFTADDVKFSLLVIADPSYTGRYGTAVQNLEGYKEYAAGETTELTGIEVVDDYNINFHFTAGYRTNMLDVCTMGIMDAETYPDFTVGNTKVMEDAMGEPVGTGPYVLSSWDAASGAAFVKNENYWGEGYAIEKIIIKPVEMTTDYQELAAGNIDMLLGMIEPSKIGPASSESHIGFVTYPRAGEGYISINASDVAGATAEKEVRQALLYAFDRETFVNSYFYCEELDETLAYVPTTMQNPVSVIGDVVNGSKEVDGLLTYEYDIDKAKSLLDGAGWTDTDGDGIRDKNGNKLTVKVIAMQDHDICDTLVPMWQEDWGNKLGIDVQVATVDFNTLLDKIYTDEGLSEWNVFFLATSYTGDDLNSIYSSFHSSQACAGGDNNTRLVDATLDQMLDDAMMVLDEAEVVSAYTEIAKRVNENAVQMPVYGNTYFDMYNQDKIANFKTSALYQWTEAIKDATLK